MIWRSLLLILALVGDSAITITGWVIVPILAALGLFEVRRSLIFPDRYVLSWTPAWALWWGNEEDGIDGRPLTATGFTQFKNAEWLRRTHGWSLFKRVVVWAALRNGASNLRYTPWWGLIINPSKVDILYANGSTSWFVAQGWRSNFWYQGDRWRFWIGWPIKPWDRSPWDSSLLPSDARAPGVGFKLQFKRAR